MLVDGISSISSKKHKRWRSRLVNVCCNTGLKPALSNAPSPPPPTRAVSVACRHCSIPISSGVGRANPHVNTSRPRCHRSITRRTIHSGTPTGALFAHDPGKLARLPPPRGPSPQVPAAFRVQLRVRPRRVRVYEQCGRFRRPIALCAEPAQRPRPPGQPSDVGQAAQAIKGLSGTRRGRRSAPPAPHPPQ